MLYKTILLLYDFLLPLSTCCLCMQSVCLDVSLASGSVSAHTSLVITQSRRNSSNSSGAINNDSSSSSSSCNSSSSSSSSKLDDFYSDSVRLHCRQVQIQEVRDAILLLIYYYSPYYYYSTAADKSQWRGDRVHVHRRSLWPHFLFLWGEWRGKLLLLLLLLLVLLLLCILSTFPSSPSGLRSELPGCAGGSGERRTARLPPSFLPRHRCERGEGGG